MRFITLALAAAAECADPSDHRPVSRPISPAGLAVRFTIASPVLTPIRTCSASCSSTTQERIASAARTARSGSSSCAVGTPNGHHGVADELLDRSSVQFEHFTQARVVRGEHGADILRIELLGAAGETD